MYFGPLCVWHFCSGVSKKVLSLWLAKTFANVLCFLGKTTSNVFLFQLRFLPAVTTPTQNQPLIRTSLSSGSTHEAGSSRFWEAPRCPLHHSQFAAVLPQRHLPHGEGPLRGGSEGADQLRGQYCKPHHPLLPSDTGLGAGRQGPSQSSGVWWQRRLKEPVPRAFSPGLPSVERGQPKAAWRCVCRKREALFCCPEFKMLSTNNFCFVVLSFSLKAPAKTPHRNVKPHQRRGKWAPPSLPSPASQINKPTNVSFKVSERQTYTVKSP